MSLRVLDGSGKPLVTPRSIIESATEFKTTPTSDNRKSEIEGVNSNCSMKSPFLYVLIHAIHRFIMTQILIVIALISFILTLFGDMPLLILIGCIAIGFISRHKTERAIYWLSASLQRLVGNGINSLT